MTRNGRGDLKRSKPRFAALSRLAHSTRERCVVPWLDSDPQVEFAREQYRAGHPNGHTDDNDALSFTVASSLAGQVSANRPWLVQDWVPCGQVTLLTGDGGVGKSLLAMQLMAALATGSSWLGFRTTPCRTFGVFAEDDENELHRRLDAIAKAENLDLANLEGMAWRCAVTDPCELTEIADGNLKPTTSFRRHESAVKRFGAKLVVLDAATNFYGGDEIKRRGAHAQRWPAPCVRPLPARLIVWFPPKPPRRAGPMTGVHNNDRLRLPAEWEAPEPGTLGRPLGAGAWKLLLISGEFERCRRADPEGWWPLHNEQGRIGFQPGWRRRRRIRPRPP